MLLNRRKTVNLDLLNHLLKKYSTYMIITWVGSVLGSICDNTLDRSVLGNCIVIFYVIKRYSFALKKILC